jgi:alkanesulfonate monooxygenase SsuD/methylene tetrahydromethanopterin reductase-like flavin-dependent oxidoreductase (luciferase family)
MLERTVAAREAGLDALFVGDHHVTPIAYFQNAPILGRLLAEWGDRTAGALFLLPLWNPVLVAEQIATLAAIAEGPFVMQCAIGDGPGQFAGMGADMRRRVRDFESGLDIIRRLLAGESVTAETPYPIQDAVVRPVPPSPVQVWIGADAENGIGRAARLGDTWYAGPSLTPDEAKAKLAYYLERCSIEGRRPAYLPIRRDVHVADSAADAERIRAASAGYRGMQASALVIGTPDEVAAEFRSLAALGFTEVVIRQLAEDHEDALASYRGLAEVHAAVADA